MSLITTDLHQGLFELFELKHDIIEAGIDLERFHATEDRQWVRDKVFSVLAHFQDVRVDSVVVQKRRAAPSIRPLRHFYPMMVENLLKYPFDPRGMDVSQYSKVFIFADRAAGRRREREALIKAIKANLVQHLRGVPYVICMHDSASHHYLQAVDYISWAIYVKWGRGELRPYNQIGHLVRSEFPIFQHGFADWY